MVKFTAEFIAQGDELDVLERLYELTLSRKYGAIRHLIELRKHELLKKARNG